MKSGWENGSRPKRNLANSKANFFFPIPSWPTNKRAWGIFLSLATALAEVVDSDSIVTGFHSLDSPNYPDTSREFVDSMERAINSGTRAGRLGRKISILSPLIGMKKEEIIRFGLELGADYSYSISCYRGEEVPCMRCPACRIRDSAWKSLGIEDHLIKRLKKEGKWHGF